MTVAPDMLGYVVGFRQWHMGPPTRGQHGEDGLWSVGSHQVRWPSATMEAQCLRFKYRLGGVSHVGQLPPVSNCKCGIYAMHQLGWPASPPEGMCIGAVKAWGRIQVHHDQFRAQHATIVALAYGGSWRSDAIARVWRYAERLDVPLVPLTQLAPTAFEHGSPVPASMRPGPPTGLSRIKDRLSGG